MVVIICPGIHPPELTQKFITSLKRAIAAHSPTPLPTIWVLPPQIAPYGPDLIYSFVTQRWREAELSPDAPTAWMGFSAGVVGAVLAARRWQQAGGVVRGLIAIDGWGVPLGDAFPRFRLGHDRFTAQSCEWLGRSDGYFYCDPAVEHLDLWRSPQGSWGHWRPNAESTFELDLGPLAHGQPINAAQLLAQLLIACGWA